MFHCNGWCFPWTVTALAGVHVCLRAVRGPEMWRLMSDHAVTHLCGAPIVMATVLATHASDRRALPHRVQFVVAGAPPPEAVLAAMQDAGFAVSHVYGLTEVYGPAVVNAWHGAWNAKPGPEQAALMARQGVRYLALEGLDVFDPETMRPVPPDGATMGEVMMRGNVVMKGYLKDPAATHSAFAGGWFHTGDLAVKYPDGYLQLNDRSKDIIISGGENTPSCRKPPPARSRNTCCGTAYGARDPVRWLAVARDGGDRHHRARRGGSGPHPHRRKPVSSRVRNSTSSKLFRWAGPLRTTVSSSDGITYNCCP